MEDYSLALGVNIAFGDPPKIARIFPNGTFDIRAHENEITGDISSESQSAGFLMCSGSVSELGIDEDYMERDIYVAPPPGGWDVYLSRWWIKHLESYGL